MQSFSAITVTVNDIPLELYDAKAEDKSLLDILNPGDVKEVNINPTYFTNVPFQKGLSTDKNKVLSSGNEKRLGIIGLLKSFDITYDNKPVLMGFHGGWHPNNMPKWRRRQFNTQGVQTFRGDNSTDQKDWLIMQLHPQNKHDILATIRVLKQRQIAVNRKNLLENMVMRNNWLFEIKDPNLVGQDSYSTWLKEQEVNEKIKLVQDGHLQILMAAEYRGHKFFNQPTLANTAAGARAYLVNQVKLPGGYSRLRKMFGDLDTAIEVDSFVSGIKSGKIKVTDYEVLRTDNGKVYLKFEEIIPELEDEAKALWIQTRMSQNDGYKEMAVYLDELSKTTKAGAAKAKIAA